MNNNPTLPGGWVSGDVADLLGLTVAERKAVDARVTAIIGDVRACDPDLPNRGSEQMNETPVDATISDRVRKLVGLVTASGGDTVKEVKRVGPGEFDVHLTGTRSLGDVGPIGFSARLDLWAIRELVPWPSAPVAKMCSYPRMALAGDWSAIRDSSEDRISLIFQRFVLPLVL